MNSNKRIQLTIFLTFIVISLSLLVTSVAQAVTNLQFENPLGNGVTIYVLLARFINWFLGISATLALLAIIIAGLKLIYHSMIGDEKGLEASKKIVMWACIGLVLIGLSFVIVRTVPVALGIL